MKAQEQWVMRGLQYAPMKQTNPLPPQGQKRKVIRLPIAKMRANFAEFITRLLVTQEAEGYSINLGEVKEILKVHVPDVPWLSAKVFASELGFLKGQELHLPADHPWRA